MSNALSKNLNSGRGTGGWGVEGRVCVPLGGNILFGGGVGITRQFFHSFVFILFINV